MKIVLIYLIFVYSSVIAQNGSLNEIISMINTKYKLHSYMEYSVVSDHQSLFSDTINFRYSTNTILTKTRSPYNIRGFFTFNAQDELLFTHTNTGLYKIDPTNDLVHFWPIEEARKILTRGDFRWATFSPLIYATPFFDTSKWNSNYVQHTIDFIGDTVNIFMNRYFEIDEKFQEDDPTIGSSSIMLTVCLSDSLIYYYQETLNISKKPIITSYNVSNYNFTPDYEKILRLENKLTNILSNDSIISYKRDTTWLSLRKPIAEAFYSHFTIYDLNGVSYSLSDFSERYLVLDFWFCGCAPCAKVSKILDNLNKNNTSKNIKIIGINYLNNSITEIISCANKTNYSQFFVNNRDEVKFMDLYGAPLVIIYDKKENKVIKAWEGYQNKMEIALGEFLYNLN